jgi:hypothetical protein
MKRYWVLVAFAVGSAVGWIVCAHRGPVGVRVGPAGEPAAPVETIVIDRPDPSGQLGRRSDRVRVSNAEAADGKQPWVVRAT